MQRSEVFPLAGKPGNNKAFMKAKLSCTHLKKGSGASNCIEQPFPAHHLCLSRATHHNLQGHVKVIQKFDDGRKYAFGFSRIVLTLQYGVQ
jgi:hypothetical protein